MTAKHFSAFRKTLKLSKHGGLGLQDGRRSEAPGKLGRALGAIAAGRRRMQLVVPPHVAL